MVMHKTKPWRLFLILLCCIRAVAQADDRWGLFDAPTRSDVVQDWGLFDVPEPVSEPPDPPALVIPSGPKQRDVKVTLYSARWCGSCPAAKRNLEQAGVPFTIVDVGASGIDQQYRAMGITAVPYIIVSRDGRTSKRYRGAVSGQTISRAVRELSGTAPARQQLPTVNTPWGTINLETYNRPNCHCAMCQGIRQLQQQYRSKYIQTSITADTIDAGQQPTPDTIIDDMLALMRLTPNDRLADLGCGDGRILISAVELYGCQAVGVEIDPVKAQEARQNIMRAEREGRIPAMSIQIITGDVLDFDPVEYGVTAITAYLYPELLEQLRPKLESARVVASPFHRVPGMAMVRHGDVWVWRRDG